MKKLFHKVQQKVLDMKIKAMNVATDKTNQVQKLLDEVQSTKFTKKAPKKIATVCSAMLVGLMPTVCFAANDTSTIDKFVNFVCAWLVKIGFVVMLVGGVMFALGWQREDAEGKTRGLQTVMAGAMVAAIGKSPDIFGL